MSNSTKKKLKLVLIISASFILIYIVLSSKITAQGIKDWVTSYGIFAPLAYVFVWAILPIFFFPVPILALAGGLSFGIIEGTILTLVGAMVNSSLMFLIARFLARDAVSNYLRRKLSPKWWERFNNIDNTNGFMLILISRLIPIMPYNVINYASGLTKLSFWRYSLATLIGIIPGTLIFLNVGDKALDISSPGFVISIILVILLIIISTLLAKKYTKKI